jgi:hypothetical protein
MREMHPEEVQRVLRRAAELERSATPAAPAARTSPAAAGHMTRGDVAQIADEVGLDPDAIRQALAEHDAGLLGAAPPATLLDRVIGPGELICTRSVAGPVAEVRATVETFFRGQLMQVKRNLGERGLIWEPAGDFVSRVRRALHLGPNLTWPREVELESSVVADPERADRVLVRLALRLTVPRQRRLNGAAAGLLAGVGVAVTAVVGLHGSPELLMALGGGVVATGSVASARKRHRDDLQRGEGALLRFLDALEHERT